MATNLGALKDGEPVPARPLAVSRARTSRRILLDRISARLVVLGGVVVIASILAILFVIAAEVYPLFKKPTATLVRAHPSAARARTRRPRPATRSVSTSTARLRSSSRRGGVVELYPLERQQAMAAMPVPALSGGAVTTVVALGKGVYLLGTSDGRTIPLDLKFEVTFGEGGRTVTPRAEFGAPRLLDPQRRRAILRLTGASTGGGPLTIAQIGPAELLVQTVVEKKALIGPSTKEESVASVPVRLDGEITALRLDGRAEDLFIGTSRGQLVWYDMREPQSPRRVDAIKVSDAPVTALGFLIGDRTLVAGDGAGGVSTWQVVPPPTGGERRLTRVHRFQGHGGPVVAIDASKRDKGFATADAKGQIHVHYGTSGQTLLSVQTAEGPALRAIAFAPKSDALLAVERGRGDRPVAGRQPAPGGHARARSSARSGTRGTRSPRTSGSRRAGPTTSRRSSA